MISVWIRIISHLELGFASCSAFWPACREFLAIRPHLCRVFSWIVTVLWSRKCVTCPRSVACLSLVFLVCHLPALSGSSWNLMPPGKRTPVLSLGTHLLQFLVITPFFIFRFHQPVAWWHPLPPTPICGKSRSWPSERLPRSPFGLSCHQPFPLLDGKKCILCLSLW